MKSLVEYINESVVNEANEIANVNEAKKKTVKTTVGEYVAWYFGVDDFQSTDFDPTSLEEFFKGSYTAQYEFLADHKDVKVTITQEETEYDDISVEFTVGKVTFTPVAMDFYKK